MSESKLQDIMVVEDDSDLRELAKVALRDIGGFTITICSSGEEALKKVSSVKPQLILLDVMMPTMDGPTTFKELKLLPEAKNIPIIFMTANTQPHEIAAYRKLGVTEVIPKPFDPMTLSDHILDIWKGI